MGALAPSPALAREIEAARERIAAAGYDEDDDDDDDDDDDEVMFGDGFGFGASRSSSGGGGGDGAFDGMLDDVAGEESTAFPALSSEPIGDQLDSFLDKGPFYGGS